MNVKETIKRRIEERRELKLVNDFLLYKCDRDENGKLTEADKAFLTAEGYYDKLNRIKAIGRELKALRAMA